MSPRDTPTSDPNQGLPPAAKQLTVKQEREQRRLAKVEAFKQQQARARRNRIIAITLSSVAGVAVIALVLFIAFSSITPKPDRDDISIEGLETWGEELDFTHVTTAVDYEEQYGIDPPAGGAHNAAWLNCGVYTEVQQNENAVHALEHGAVWATYDAEALSQDEIDTLVSALPGSYVVVSTYEGLDAPVVLAAWGAQVELDGVDDPRIGDFVDKFWKNPELPENGAACTGAIDGPGKIA